jgi:hypothetical protein
MRIADLNTRDRANIGQEFDVPGPDGKPTGQKITLLHGTSDRARAGRAIVQAKVPDLELSKRDLMERYRLQDELLSETLAYLVVGWTLEDECTLENAKALFLGSPYLIDWADAVTSRGGRFFTKASVSLNATPRRGRSSKGQRARAAN